MVILFSEVFYQNTLYKINVYVMNSKTFESNKTQIKVLTLVQYCLNNYPNTSGKIDQTHTDGDIWEVNIDFLSRRPRR